MVKMQFSAEEFEVLSDLIFLGNWIVNASRLADKSIKKYEDLTTKMLELFMNDRTDDDRSEDITDYYYDKLVDLIDYYDNKGYLVKLAENMAKHKYPDIKDTKDENFFINHIRQFAAKEAYEKTLQKDGLKAVEIKVDNLNEKIASAERAAKSLLKDSR